MTTSKNFELNQICGGTGSYRPSFYRVVKLTAKTAWFQRLQTHQVEADRWGQEGKLMPLNIDDKRQKVFNKTHDASWPSRVGLQYCFEKYLGFLAPWNKEPQTFSTYD